MGVELMATIKVVMLDAPEPPDALQIQDPTILTPGPEQVLIKVAAFSLNRSERGPVTVAVAAQRIQAVC